MNIEYIYRDKLMVGELIDFGVKTCKIKIFTSYGKYREGTIVRIKTSKLKFIYKRPYT